MIRKLRASVIVIVNGKRTPAPAGDFPGCCPNCELPWKVSESWIANGPLQSGGRDAVCAACGCVMFEVIDRWFDVRLAFDKYL